MKKQLLPIATIFCLLLSTFIVHAQGLITTIAGTGTVGYNGDSILATNAKLNFTISICINSTGDIFIADGNNQRVRKIKTSTGIITTIAGTGVQGFSGDSILAINSQLTAPVSVACDLGGNIFIADYGNMRIRRVDATTGIITTVAGDGIQGFSGDSGLAINAHLNFPVGVTVDHLGNIFIADKNNHRIRKVTVGTGIITTVAGNGNTGYFGDNVLAINTSLNYPLGVSVNSIGDLFIADGQNNRIRKVSASTGIITTIAGTGIAGYSGENILAVNSKIFGPDAIFLDSLGNVFLPESGNSRVRKINATNGIITTVAGNGIAGYNGDNILSTFANLYNPRGVCSDVNGNVYIVDSYNQRIRKIMTGTSVTDPVAGRVQVYPNPCSGVFTVGVGVHSGAAEISIFNMLGQQVYTATISGAEHTVNIASQPDGVYMLYVKTADNVTTQRLVVAK